MADIVGTWEVSLSDGNHQIAFEHGTTTGKRVIIVDGKEILRKNWMFRLVGREEFRIGNAKATIIVEAVSGFAYEYTLEVNGKPLKKFVENRKRTAKVWTLLLDGTETRIVLEKGTMDVWVNGETVQTAGEFVEDGTETHFKIADHNCYIRAVSSGMKKTGIVHTLFIDDNEIPQTLEDC